MKRNVFAELVEGFEALEADRNGRITLRQHHFETKPAPELKPEEVRAVRERLNLSRAVFARALRTNERTLENWEQGRAAPNAQARLLIRMAATYPDTVERLAHL